MLRQILTRSPGLSTTAWQLSCCAVLLLFTGSVCNAKTGLTFAAVKANEKFRERKQLDFDPASNYVTDTKPTAVDHFGVVSVACSWCNRQCDLANYNTAIRLSKLLYTGAIHRQQHISATVCPASARATCECQHAHFSIHCLRGFPRVSLCK